MFACMRCEVSTVDNSVNERIHGCIWFRISIALPAAVWVRIESISRRCVQRFAVITKSVAATPSSVPFPSQDHKYFKRFLLAVDNYSKPFNQGMVYAHVNLRLLTARQPQWWMCFLHKHKWNSFNKYVYSVSLQDEECGIIKPNLFFLFTVYSTTLSGTDSIASNGRVISE